MTTLVPVVVESLVNFFLPLLFIPLRALILDLFTGTQPWNQLSSWISRRERFERRRREQNLHLLRSLLLAVPQSSNPLR
jgi:uncharacterized membrane protein